MIHKNYVVIKNKFLESLIGPILPQHKRFIDAAAGDCEIHAHKKPCRLNVLNWTGNMSWPNDNAIEYLEYEKTSADLDKFISEEFQFFDGDLLYIDLRNATYTKANLTKLLDWASNAFVTNVNVIVLGDESSVDISSYYWCTDVLYVVDTFNNKLIPCYSNFDFISNTNFSRLGSNKSERQALMRKLASLNKKFDSLSEREQQVLFQMLLDSFIRD